MSQSVAEIERAPWRVTTKNLQERPCCKGPAPAESARQDAVRQHTRGDKDIAPSEVLSVLFHCERRMLGHIDRKGLRDDAPARSWNSSHPSRGPDGGCSQADLRSTGGDGLFYCFAAQ
jgi:hypothetical protein